MASTGSPWSEVDQTVLMTLHRLVRLHDEAEYSSSSRTRTTDAVHAYNLNDDQYDFRTAFSLLTFPSSSNSHSAVAPISSCQPRQVTHAQIDSVLTDLCKLTDAGFVWIDLVDLSSLPILARHFDIHDACLRGTYLSTVPTTRRQSLLALAHIQHSPTTPRLTSLWAIHVLLSQAWTIRTVSQIC